MAGKNEKNTNAVLLNIIKLIDERECGSVKDFALRVGINPTNYYTWIMRNSRPDAKTQGRICEVYGVTAAWLNDDSATHLLLPAKTRRASEGEYGASPPMVDQSELAAELRARLVEVNAAKEETIVLLKRENDTLRAMLADKDAEKDKRLAELEIRATAAERREEGLKHEISQLKNDRKPKEGVRVSDNSKNFKLARVVV